MESKLYQETGVSVLTAEHHDQQTRDIRLLDEQQKLMDEQIQQINETISSPLWIIGM
jgi:Tfp pilus assembly protein PilN